jgi:ketosteroid isomerase-like protein
MSEESATSDLNVERLRSFFQTWDPSEWARGENMSLFDPELIYEGDVLPDQVGETYHGHEGLARATRTWLDPIDEIAVELERIIGTGDCLVSVQRASGKMRHTGIQMARAYAYLWRFRDGQVAYLKTFGNTQEALNAAGLSE